MKTIDISGSTFEKLDLRKKTSLSFMVSKIPHERPTKRQLSLNNKVLLASPYVWIPEK